MSTSDIKAFGKWDTLKLEGNPFAQKGSLKVFLHQPKVPMIFDTVNNRLGFITLQIASSGKFMLPKANRTDAEKKQAVYFAVYSDANEWEIKDGAYAPLSGTDAAELVKRIIPPAKPTAQSLQAERHAAEQEALRLQIANDEDSAPYKNFPLTQRQALEQAAYLQEVPIEKYIEEFLPESRKAWAYEKFGLDTPVKT